MNLLDTIRELEEKGLVQDVIIDLEKEEQACELSFEGTLEEFIKAVYANKIQLIKVEGQIVGLSYITNLSYISDQIAQRRFAKAYGYKPVNRYVDLAFNLLSRNEIVSKVVDDYYVYCLRSGSIIDLNNQEVLTISAEDVMAYLENHITEESKSIRDIINEMLDEKLVEHLQNRIVKEADRPSRQVEPELPKEVTISKSALTRGTTLENQVKCYLRDNYDRYLAKDAELEIVELIEEDKVIVSNITWGRKKY